MCEGERKKDGGREGRREEEGKEKGRKEGGGIGKWMNFEQCRVN